MKRREALLALAGGVVLAGSGIKVASAEEKKAIVLCSKCGQVKGSDKCCKAGAAVCGKCGLHAGSPGCCKIPKDAKKPYTVCASCGQIKGTSLCCKAGAKKCAKCGMHAGSPGCCIKCAAMAAKKSCK